MEAPTFGYVANRSPTGDASALLVSRADDGRWMFQPDEGGPLRELVGRHRLYAKRDEAVLIARFLWRCNGGRPRSMRPVSIGYAEGK
jgi:hypothetical protein